MKKYSLIRSAAIALAAFLSVSCVGKILNDTISDDDLPKGVLPSKEMTYGNAADEKYAAHAARFTFESSAEFPYVSMELFGDGCYLISRTFTRSDDGGIYVEGGYTVTEDNIYILENFGTLKIEENQDGYNLIFDNTAGNRISVVYAEKTPAISGDATKSLCRTWRIDTIEDWMYMGSKLIIKTKYYGGENPRIEGSVGVTEDDMKNQIDNICKEMRFSPYGTYHCTYNNGTTRVSTWEWGNEEQGILFFDWEQGEQDEGYVTIRFSGKQLRTYEDYSFDIAEYIEEEADEEESQAYIDIIKKLTGNATLRYLIVNTLTAI